MLEFITYKLLIKLFRLVLIFLLVGIGLNAHAQNVSINDSGQNPDNSAMLDVSDTSRGVLIPRLSLNQRNAISSPATGLLIYQSDNNAGFYYNEGSPGSPNWVKISTGSNSSDQLNDADNNTRIEVEQTSNDDLIRFTQNGTEFLQLDSGLLRLKNTNGNIYLGDGAGVKPFLSSNNIGIGRISLSSSTTGRDNVGIGSQTMVSGTGSVHRENIAIGTQALQSGTSSYGNVAIGMRALNVNSSLFNVAIGRDAMRFNNGANNVAIGQESGFSNLGSGNVFLGNKAGYNETGSNKLYLDNSDTSTPLVYGDFSDDSLAINGNANVSGNLYLSNGNLGIGTNSPNNQFTVYSSTTGAYFDLKGVGDAFNFSGFKLDSDEATDKSWSILHRKIAGGQNETNNLAFEFFDGSNYNQRLVLKGNGNVGIGTVVPDSMFEVNGGAQIGRLNIAGEYTFPDSDGNFNEVLTTNGSGKLAWQTVSGVASPWNISGSDLGYNAGNVGIGTNSPNANLSINGSISRKISTLDIGTTNNINNLSIPADGDIIRIIGPNSTATISGIQASFDGRFITFFNASSFSVTFSHNGGGSTASNRILMHNGGDLTLPPNSSIQFAYSTADSRWIGIGYY